MASGSDPVTMPASPVHGSQVSTAAPVPSGKSLPQGGKSQPAAPQAAARNTTQDVEAQIALLNKALNDSGRPAQFRVAPNSGASLIQEINPANGAVIGEYPTVTFPELARSLGISSALIDELA